MRLLFDQNLSPRLARLLADLFPDSAPVIQVGLDMADDETVWRYAALENMVIVSKDLDFYDIATLRGAPPYVIWIRRGNCSTLEIEAIIRRWSDDINHLYDEGGPAVLILL